VLQNTGALAILTRLGNNPALTMTLATNSGIDELTKEATLYPAYLTSALAAGTSAGLTTRLRASTTACGTYLIACYIYFPFAAQGCFFKRDGNFVAYVGTAPGCLASRRTCATKKGFKYVSKAAKVTKVNSLKSPPEEALGTSMPIAVIDSTLAGIREHLVSLVYFLELVRSPVLTIAVGMILKRQLTKSLLYRLIGSVSGNAQNLIVIPLYCHYFTCPTKSPCEKAEDAKAEIQERNHSKGTRPII
jgi:hypothetical protein